MVSDHSEIARGTFHPPKSSAALAASLHLDGGRVHVRLLLDDARPVETDLSSITISSRVGRIPRKLTFADGALFETADNDAIDRMMKASGSKRVGLIHELERVHPRLIGLAVAVFLLGALIYRYALPALVEVAVLFTPPVAAEMLSSGTLSSLDQTMLSKSELTPAEQAPIQQGFDALAAFSERGSAKYKLNFRKGGYIGPNAFALPDGTLVLTDELVALAKGDTEMILGVLAHEIGHVEKDHSLRQLYRAAGTAGLIMLIAGDIGSGAEELLTDGAALLSLSYSRSAESEADHVSVSLMAKAGRDPAAIGRFFALLEKQLGDKGGTSMFSTHPGTPDRRKQIDAWAAELGKTPKQ